MAASRDPNGLPPGFVFSRRYTSAEQGAKEMAVAASIAQSAHGFGELVTAQEPFYLIPVGASDDTAFSAEALSKELETIAAASDGKVVITGFNRPMGEMQEAA